MKFSTASAFALGALCVAATGTKRYATLPARAPIVRSFGHDGDPVSQLRYSFNGTTGISVSWNSPSQISNPTVWYSENPDQVFNDGVAVGSPSTIIDSADTWDNHVPVVGLKPFTKYFYAVTDQNLSSQDQQESFFTTARPKGAEDPFSVAIWGDLGIIDENNHLPATFGSLAANRDTFEFMWHSGDYGYADDWSDEVKAGFLSNSTSGVELYTNIMSSYFNEIAAVSNNKPYLNGAGNHEAQCDESDVNICPPGQRNFTLYRNHFSQSTVNQTEGFVQNLWHSWDYGMVHFVQIHTETDFDGAPDITGGIVSGPFGAPGQQVAWLENDLKNVDRTVTPWVVVAGHRPWYGVNRLCPQCQDAFDSIINKYGVDLMWFGHNHYYERDQPLINGQPDPAGYFNPTGPMYLTMGGSGNFEGHFPPAFPIPPYTQHFDNINYGWVRLSFNSPTELTTEFIHSGTGEVADTITLVKNHGRC